MKNARLLNNLCGIDVGCTNIKMVAIISNHTVQKTVHTGDEFTQQELISTITDFYQSFNCIFEGLGIAFSGITIDGISVNRTTMQCLTNLNITHFNHLNCNRIRFINDSNATALAGLLEYPNARVLLGITNGTGIGAGFVINGNLFTGANGLAGEIYGNPTINSNNEIIKMGKICSGSKILNKVNCTDNVMYKDNIIKESAYHLGMQLISLIHAFNPDILYLSGGGFSFPNYTEYLCEFISKHSYKQFMQNLEIVQSAFSSYAGCFGAMNYLLL